MQFDRPGYAAVMVDGTTKGVRANADLAVEDIAARGWNVLAGDTGTPVAVLRDAALDHNIDVMRAFCLGEGVAIAPHGKTTLAPALLHRQLAAGAWGITAANAQQAVLMSRAGVRRIFIANEVVDPAALTWINDTLDADPALDISWYVDSLAGLDLARASAAGHGRRPRLVVELGYLGGRTGVRDDAAALQLAGDIAAAPEVELVGVSGYEGTIAADREAASISAVREFLTRLRDLYLACRTAGLLARPGLVSAGGSVYFDVVADVLGSLAGDGTTVLLRSGCYLTHDHGLYDGVTPAGRPGWRYQSFQPALEVWARVVSRPEPGLVLLDAGRRDLSHDAGMPVPVAWSRPAEPARRELRGAYVPGLSDQHTFVRIEPGSPLEVGDLVALGISHPCTTFDRWPMLMLVNDGDRVIDVVETMF